MDHMLPTLKKSTVYPTAWEIDLKPIHRALNDWLTARDIDRVLWAHRK